MCVWGSIVNIDRMRQNNPNRGGWVSRDGGGGGVAGQGYRAR